MKNNMPYVLVSVMLLSLGATLAMASESNTNGAKIYRQYCIACHGSEGQGDGDRAKNEQLEPRPRVHANGDYMNI